MVRFTQLLSSANSIQRANPKAKGQIMVRLEVAAVAAVAAVVATAASTWNRFWRSTCEFFDGSWRVCAAGSGECFQTLPWHLHRHGTIASWCDSFTLATFAVVRAPSLSHLATLPCPDRALSHLFLAARGFVGCWAAAVARCSSMR